MGINAEQWAVLMKPLNPSRISTRRQGGKDLSYLQAYDVRAHLIRVFGFGNFDVQTLEYQQLPDRPYLKDGKEMVEVMFSAHVQLDVRDPEGKHISSNAEVAVGSASGPVSQYGELADNAIKGAVSDAMKRCALSWGTAFGLGLYDNGSRSEIVKGTIVKPVGVSTVETPTDPEAERRIRESLGATEIEAQ